VTQNAYSDLALFRRTDLSSVSMTPAKKSGVSVPGYDATSRSWKAVAQPATNIPSAFNAL
jgi:hypothetical protein